MYPKTTVLTTPPPPPLQTTNVAYFQRKINFSGFSAYPACSSSQLIRISGILVYTYKSARMHCHLFPMMFNLMCISPVAEYVTISICERKREVLTETWKELHMKRHNLCYTRCIVTAIKFNVSYMGRTCSTCEGGEQFLQNFNLKNRSEETTWET
jgi:hypothetical protein